MIKYRVIKTRGLIKYKALKIRILEMDTLFNSIDGIQSCIKEWGEQTRLISITVIFEPKTSLQLQEYVKWIFQRNYISVEILDLKESDIKMFHNEMFHNEFKPYDDVPF